MTLRERIVAWVQGGQISQAVGERALRVFSRWGDTSPDDVEFVSVSSAGDEYTLTIRPPAITITIDLSATGAERMTISR